MGRWRASEPDVVLLDLTPRELALLKALQARPGHAVSKERLFELVFPGELEVQYEAVDQRALSAVNTAYDRTLLASAKSIGEHIVATGEGASAALSATVPYAALEPFEADNRSRMVYHISSTQGSLIDGFTDLPTWQGTLPERGPYAALVDFYDDVYRGDPVRVAVLLQPVAMERARVMAVVQVAETLELRRTLARQILIDTLWRQFALVSVIAGVVIVVVQRATRPVRLLSARLQARSDADLTPLQAPGAPRELIPLIDATNSIMTRLRHCARWRWMYRP
jgi:two-component system sensor histidine kinase TctE